MPDKFIRATVFRGDDRLAGGPSFQRRDTEWFIAAGHADGIASFVKVDQIVVRGVAEKSGGMSDAQLVGAMLQAPAHVAVPGEYDFRVRIMMQESGERFEQEIGAFLH